jgi:hypothetical protein
MNLAPVSEYERSDKMAPQSAFARFAIPNLKQLMPELERIDCQRGQVLMDADSSLDHVFFPESGVVSVGGLRGRQCHRDGDDR